MPITSTGAGEQRDRQEEASHRNAGIADGCDDRDQRPQEHLPDAQFNAPATHHEKRSNEDESGAAVHIDGGANRKDKAGDLGVHAQTLLGR